jgi:hypothetical protein
MPVFGIDGLRRRRERRIGEGADGDGHHFRFTVGLPVNGRAAIGTEVEADGIPGIR